MHGGVLVDSAERRFGDETAGYSEYAARVLQYASGHAWIVLDERIKQACLSFQDFRDTVESGALRSGRDPPENSRVLVGSTPTVSWRPWRRRGPAPRTVPRILGVERSWEAAPTSPYHAAAVRPALFHTQGGLVVVDEHARVLSAVGPIDGLYASGGGAAAGISGHGASGYLAGNGLLPALGLAFLCAEHVAGWQT